ncbi:class I SAM-dependent methyltransferase [Dictyobacter formicarum]|uniref:Methyltransferase type 11 domain-containing protein n=1 Tax=Dictyobacter formicarum TaxID=2778368 RepID=A0ABQ3VF53_9CHLR|nr:class I SAM-dependent methyltransferase [Dictyobacter formicarum]GHO83761.1 hypothetical protein KSZ_17670 [Dictyobacter formicarum]
MGMLHSLLERVPGVSQQYRRPQGVRGWIAGDLMAEQHRPENVWTISLLDVQPGERILEVGFGPGVALQRLLAQRKAAHVTGIDVSPTMVQSARRRNLRAINAGLLDLICADVSQLPCASESFDKVYSIHVLYFWPDPQPILKELYRVLKPGGRLYLTFLPQEKWPGDAIDSPACRIYTGEQLAASLLTAGFQHTSIESGPLDKNFREIAIVATR